jgi:hypothetical protein
MRYSIEEVKSLHRHLRYKAEELRDGPGFKEWITMDSTSWHIRMYLDYGKDMDRIPVDCLKALESDLQDIPVMINDESLIVREIVAWRLEHVR